MAILRRQRQLMWGLVESNSFKFRHRVKREKISENHFEILLLCAILHLQVPHGVQFLFIRSNGEVMMG